MLGRGFPSGVTAAKANPSPTLPFAARKGGSCSAEPCSAGALPVRLQPSMARLYRYTSWQRGIAARRIYLCSQRFAIRRMDSSWSLAIAATGRHASSSDSSLTTNASLLPATTT